MNRPDNPENSIAIIGLAGRFPKAGNIDAFWQNVCRGVEGVSFFSEEEMEAAGLAVPKDAPHYVRARGVLDEADLFDAAFFGVNPKEAEVMDPQHRVFLECAWEALESAGWDPEQYDGSIGVFAGMSMNTYLAQNVLSHPELIDLLGEYQVMLGNDKDFLPTRVSYKLNLKGPSLNIQTACSTSLVAVCTACQHLLNHTCDMALAGAVSISFPQKKGYFYQEGGIASPDGHCRAFDAKAAGTVAGEGVGIVVLKRLEDAQADGDSICAVIRGFAINNDGAMKIGYTAPSVQGQAEVIAAAQAMAGVEPETLGYIEAHGTGTPLGDPIEIEGLVKAFRAGTAAKNFCGIGSVKSNIGHLDTAAGVAGLIKTALALRNKLLPPTLHFEAPNPTIDFANSPFFVNHTLREWPAGATPRRAGVSAFGIGGTNAHVVLEEASAAEAPDPARPAQLLLLSAKTPAALDRATANLAAHLKENPAVDLADVAYTLQLGRRGFTHRRTLVARRPSDAVEALEKPDAKRVWTRAAARENPPLVFLFPGQGAQHVNMALELYENEAAFREQVDFCCDVLKPRLELDLRTVLYPSADAAQAAEPLLTQTRLTQPALFVIEYALAKLWMSWGAEPEAMMGHSIGEYVAACLAGVFPVEEALTLVAARGRLMQEMPAGSMLAVRLAEAEVQPLLRENLSLAAVNGVSSCVVSGPGDAIAALQNQLGNQGVLCRSLQTSHAFHSAMMDPILPRFAELVGRVKRRAPRIPFISNVTGAWITPEQAADPMYWAKHLRRTVRCADGLNELFKRPERVFLEVGPGQTLGTLAKQHPARNPQTLTLCSLPHSQSGTPDLDALLSAVGQLWLAGATINWRAFHAHARRRRVRLPTYPFERKRFWVEPAKAPSVKPIPHATADVQSSQAAPAAEIVGERVPAPSAPLARKERIETALRTLLGELSGLDLATRDSASTFAEMGFDSLFLTQASLAIEKKLGVRVAFRQLLEEFSSLGALARHIDAAWPAGESPAAAFADGGRHESTAPECILGKVPAAVPPPASAEIKPGETFPLTESQQELWFASQISDAASCAYNECRLLDLRGPLQPDALRAALQQVVDRHEALRTTFARAGDAQQVRAAVKLNLPDVDWSQLDPSGHAARLDAVQIEEARRPFDLVTGPLLRGRLIRLSGQHHVLLLSVHHIVCDGHAFGILLRELGELYSAQCRGVPSPMAPPLQLRDYVRAQARRSTPDERAATEAYWLGQFAVGAPPLDLPADRPRPPAWTFDGANESRPLPAALGQGLKRVSAEQHCTLFTTLLAAQFVLLHRLTGQPDIVIGIPTADRTMEGGDSLVGHCVNFLPLRAPVREECRFAEQLAALQKQFLDAHGHPHYTFGALLQKLNLPRDPSRLPLVSVTFNFGRFHEALRFAGLETALAVNAHSFTNFDLGLDVTEIHGVLHVNCRYNTSLFEASTIRRWLEHYQTLLEGVVADPRQRVADLPILSAAEMRRLLVEWNETRAEYPRAACLHQLFEEQAQRTPEATAVVCSAATLSYRELNERADQLAGRLRGLGIGPDVPVGLCLERSLELVVAVLAVLKAGGAYVPLDPAYPPARLAAMLANARMPVLLTQEKLRNRCQSPEANCRLVCLDAAWEAAPQASPDLPPAALPAPSSANLAYVIHTSGSTGVPKGVAIEHRSAVNFICWAQTVFTREELAGVLFSTSICFDLSVFELFVPLSCGGKVIVAQNALALPQLPAHGDVTLINTVPSAAAELLRLRAIPPSVRVVNLAGEPLKTALVDRLYASGTVRKVYDLYGPSETTTYSTFALRQAGAPATIGRPIANTQIYVLDAHQRPAPIGVAGEIYIGGDGVARGYLHRPDLTAERFVALPFLEAPGTRLYRTGDLARYWPDGRMELLGRSDHQVKVRGFRIELDEIETRLAAHPAVRESVVVVREDAPGDKRLVAYLVCDQDRGSVTAGELREFLGQTLPEYMAPSAFVFLDALPRTPNGKVNRRVLPAPDPARPDLADAFTAPNTPTEEALAQIWREVLNLRQVGTRDNFFALGGHSLLITQVISRVREAFQVELPMRRFFGSPTIAALAVAIEEILIDEINALSDEEARHLTTQS